jgi:Mrp family chromosome partitioning ATPase
MSAILDFLNQRSDIVLIDTPPALTVTDASILASQVDGILIVVKAGKTKMDSVKRMVTSFRQQGTRLLGVVINDVNFKNPRYSYFYQDYNNSTWQRKGDR